MNRTLKLSSLLLNIFAGLSCLIFPAEPSNADASTLIYTIQIGSFTDLERAENEFVSAMKKLLDKNSDYLRIEKIGKYNAVRTGKFKIFDNAEKYFISIKPHFASAFIIQAYIRNKRIVKELRQDPAQKKN